MSIHSDVPKPPSGGIDSDTLARLRALMPRMIGPDRVMTCPQISRAIGLPHDGKDAKTRKALKILLVNEHVPIVGTNGGMFVARTREEAGPTIENLNRRIAGLQRNVRALEAIFDAPDDAPEFLW